MVVPSCWPDFIDRARLRLPEEELDWLDVFWPTGVTIAEIGTREVGGRPGPDSKRGEAVADGKAPGDGKGAPTTGRGAYGDSAATGTLLAPPPAAAAASCFARASAFVGRPRLRGGSWRRALDID